MKLPVMLLWLNVIGVFMNVSFIQPRCISVFIVHSKGNDHNYLLIRRCGEYLTNTWQMVTGGIDEGETAWQAALREIFEETGLIPNKLYSADAVETFYLKSIDKMTCVPVFLATIDTLQSIKLSPTEHDAYEWLSFEKAHERLVWSEQKRILKHIHENFVLNPPHPLHLIDIPIK